MNTRRSPGLGVRSRQGGIGIISADFFVAVAGAKASRLRQRSLRVFFESLPIPTDASGAYRPNPQANNEVCRPPPLLNGYRRRVFFLDLHEIFQYAQKDCQ
jgi:hypothetical protein